jgi:hypothetical protein
MRKVHGWRRAARWIVGIFGGLLGLVAVALIVAFVVFQTGWGRGVLKNQIESRLDNMFVGGAKIGRLEGNPLSELVLNDVVINGPDKQPAIMVKRLTVKLPLLPLISHELRVQKVIAEQLDVRAKKLESGEWNLAKLMKPAEEKSTWSIKLPNVEVHRGHLLVDQGKGSEPIDIDNLEVYVDAKLPFGGPIDANARVTGQWRQKQAPVSIGGTFHIGQDMIEVGNAAVQLGEVRVVALGAKIPKGEASLYAKPMAGTVAVTAPAREVHRLVPQVELPADIALSASAKPEGRLTHFSVLGSVGKAQVSVFGRADVQAKLASIVVGAADLELAKLTNGKLAGTGGVFAALQVDGTTKTELPTASGIVHAWSTSIPNAPPINAAIAIDTRDDLIRTTIGATSGSGIRAGAGAVVRKRGEVITLERGDLIARTLDIRRASAGKSPVGGVLSARLHAKGKLAPKPDLAVEGTANGRRLRMQDMKADRLAFRIDAKHLPDNPVGSGRVELYDVERGNLRFGKLTVAAGNRPDGKLQVTVRSQPKPAPWRVDLDALVTTGDTIVVDLQRHLVRASANSLWQGKGGRITITPKRIDVVGLRSQSKDGTLAADASYVRAGKGRGDLQARVDASLDIGKLLDGKKGKVDAKVDIARKDNRFNGTVVANAKGIMLDPKSPIAIDADAKIEAREQQVLANVNIATLRSGRAKLVVDVDAPKDITDARAWRLLGRDSIRTAQLTLQGVKLDDVAKATKSPPMAGRIDGTLELSPAKAGGALAIRGVQLPQTKDLGSIHADLTLAQKDKDELKTTLIARLVPHEKAVAAKDVTKNGQAKLFVDANLKTPDRIFDPAAWRRLGHMAFRGATVRGERLAFQPGTLERLGIVSQLRGELGFGADIGPGLHEVRYVVSFHNLRGGLLAKPIALNLVGAVDEKSTRARIDVRHDGVTLVHVTADIPVSIDELRENPQVAKTKPLRGEARIEQVPAVKVMNVLGTSQIQSGTLDGTVTLGGTVGKPTVDAKLVARDVRVPDEGRRQVQQIEELTIAAKWDGAAGNVAIDGNQSAGGRLRIRASGSPDDLDKVNATLFAKNVDIAPLVAFMPGPAGGLAGKLEADFKLRGANPKTADLAGNLHIAHGRIPIAPAVGTLFEGDMRVEVRNKELGARMTGKLGRGDVSVAVNAPLDGVTPKSGKAKVTLRKVQLIGTTEPILTGEIDADLARIGDTWRTNVRIVKMDVKVPKEKGTKLSPVGAPTDLVYGGEKIHHGKNKGKDVPQGIVKDSDEQSGTDFEVAGATDLKAPSQVEGPMAKRKLPSDPAIVAYITMRNVFVESQEVRGLVNGRLTVSVANNKEVGIVGNMSLSRAVLDLFNRRYQVDKAALYFDGSPDPVLDVRITHDFPEVTTITEVRGRMSKPQLLLSSEPGRYSQAELLGFLLGGEPDGDPDNAPSATERVAGAGASIIGNKVGGYVKKALPVDVDVLRYEAASSTSSAAVTVGTWITDTLFLAYRQHLDARPDENAGQAELEYWLRRRLVVEGVIGDRGVNGVDLLWRRRW